nr:AC5 [East African cassava mosaic virus]
MIIHYMIIDPKKLFNQSLFLHPRGSTNNSRIEFTKHLIPVPKIILHGCRSRFIIKHVEHLSKILRARPIRPSISHEKKHNMVRMILLLDILIHPDLAQYIYGLHTKPLTDPMGKARPTSHITDHRTYTKVFTIIPLLKRLDLTWAFTALRDIWASIHSVHLGLPIHGPVGPYFASGDADSGGNNTVRAWAVEVQPSPHLGYGC